MSKKNEIVMTGYFDVLENVKKHIIASQYKVMTTVNIERNILYWNIGKMIEEYSQWGSKFVENLSKDLRKEYPNSTGYTVNNLNYMSQFFRRIRDEEILHQSGQKLVGRR